MNLFQIFVWGCVVSLALCILVPIVQAISKSAKERAKRREKERQEAEQERIRAEKQSERERQQAERERVAAAKRAERERQQAAKLEAARQLAEYNRAALNAAKELRQLNRETEPHSDAAETIQAEPEARRPAIIPSHGNEAFTGQVVSFTGTLPGMKRREAIAAVEANGGKAFADMPAGTTLLVVGDRPGMNKLDKADQWIGQVRKITTAQFKAMLNQPLALTPDEFAARFAPCA